MNAKKAQFRYSSFRNFLLITITQSNLYHKYPHLRLRHQAFPTLPPSFNNTNLPTTQAPQQGTPTGINPTLIPSSRLNQIKTSLSTP